MSARTVGRGSGLGVLGGSLVTACVVLAAILASQLVQSRSEAAAGSAPATEQPASQDGAVVPAVAGAALSAEPLERFREIVERPLFHVSRRSAPPDSDETAQAVAVDLRNLTLVGVLISPETKLAIFRDKGPQALRVEAGANLGKWSLAEVRSDGITLRKGSETHVIPLHKVDSPQWSSTDGESQVATAEAGNRVAAAQSQVPQVPVKAKRVVRKHRSS